MYYNVIMKKVKKLNYSTRFIFAIASIVLVWKLYNPYSFWVDVLFFILVVYTGVKFFNLDK